MIVIIFVFLTVWLLLLSPGIGAYGMFELYKNVERLSPLAAGLAAGVCVAMVSGPASILNYIYIHHAAIKEVVQNAIY